MMKKRGKNRRAQIQISFGMIFSIILIIAFIALAIYIIMVFLGWKTCTETGLFKQDLQEAIDNAWSRDMHKETFTKSLSGGIEKVCFVDLSKASKGNYKEYYSDFELQGKGNLFFFPLKKACEGQRSFNINHLNIDKITEQDNPYCMGDNGKIEIKIEKEFNENLVNII